MIRHIVMWKFKDEAEGMKKPEIIEKVLGGLASLVGKVPVIRGLEVGGSMTGGDDMHYDMALVVTLDKIEDLPLYDGHPEHVKVREFIGKVRTARVTADIEV